MLLVMKRPVALTRYPAFFRDAARIEETAAEFHQYAPLIVPGMLQTEEYAKAMFTVWRPRRSEAEIEQMVSARLERHKLLDRKPAPVLSTYWRKQFSNGPSAGWTSSGESWSICSWLGRTPTWRFR
jgi:hypothetical protein